LERALTGGSNGGRMAVAVAVLAEKWGFVKKKKKKNVAVTVLLK
jgi:hypothetical protein